MIPDYYKLLGVAASASAQEIKRAYRRQARLRHPDLNAQARDEQIKRVNEAYEILSNAQKRAAYDELRRQARKRAEALRLERERLRREEELARREPEITWVQGLIGFVRELKKEMRDD